MVTTKHYYNRFSLSLVQFLTSTFHTALKQKSGRKKGGSFQTVSAKHRVGFWPFNASRAATISSDNMLIQSSWHMFCPVNAQQKKHLLTLLNVQNLYDFRLKVTLENF